MPPPAGDSTIPPPLVALTGTVNVGGFLPFQTKAQELRAKVLKQPALLNAWKGKNPNPFGLQCSGQGNQRGLESRDFHNDVSTGVIIKPAWP